VHMLFNEKNIQRIAMNAMLPGLEMSLRNHLELLNQARQAIGLPPMRVTSDDAPEEIEAVKPRLLAIGEPARRGRPAGGAEPQQPADWRSYDARLLWQVKQWRRAAWSVRRISEETGISAYKTLQMVKVVDRTRDSVLEQAAGQAMNQAQATPAQAAPVQAAPVPAQSPSQPAPNSMEDKMAAAKALRESGFTYPEIARRLGISVASANRWTKLAGHETQPGNYAALRSHTGYRWRIVKEAGLDSGGKLPSNKLLQQAEKILEDRKQHGSNQRPH
jgi:transposase-like protein